MKDLNFFLSVPPCRSFDAPEGFRLSLASYSVGREFRLMRAPCPAAPGGLLEADMRAFTGYGPHPGLIERLIRECVFRDLSGMVLRLPRPTASIAAFCRLLETEARRRGLGLWLPESYARVAEGAKLLVPSMCLAGTYRSYVEKRARLYGADRLALDFNSGALEFNLPALSGRGTAVPVPGAGEGREFYSSELSLRYISRVRRGRVRVTVWEDETAAAEKIALALALGVKSFFLPCADDGERWKKVIKNCENRLK